MFNDLLNSLQRDGAITEAVSLRSFAWILSGPVAFVTSKGFEHGLVFANRER